MDRSFSTQAQAPVPGTGFSSYFGSDIRKSTSDRVEVSIEDSTKWVQARGLCRRVIEKKSFQCFIVGVVVLDYVLVVLDVDARADRQSSSTLAVLVSLACFMCYCAELVLRAVALGLVLFADWGNWLDLFIVLSGLFDILFEGVASDSMVGLLRMLRLLRLLRLLKLLRLIRNTQFFSEVTKLLSMIDSCMHCLFWAFLTVFLAMSIWSTLAVELVRPVAERLSLQGAWPDCERCGRSFASVMSSNLTFFTTIVAGDSWGKVAVPIMEEAPLTSIIFVGSHFTLVYGILQLIVCVVVDRFAEIRETDMAERALERAGQEREEKRRLAEMFMRIDEDQSGQVSLDELEGGAERVPEFAQQLTALDIGRTDLRELFSLLDEDGSGEIDPDEFIETIYRMKYAESKTAMHFVKHMIIMMRAEVRKLTDALDEGLFSGVQGTGAAASLTRWEAAVRHSIISSMSSPSHGTGPRNSCISGRTPSRSVSPDCRRQGSPFDERQAESSGTLSSKPVDHLSGFIQPLEPSISEDALVEKAREDFEQRVTAVMDGFIQESMQRSVERAVETTFDTAFMKLSAMMAQVAEQHPALKGSALPRLTSLGSRPPGSSPFERLTSLDRGLQRGVSPFERLASPGACKGSSSWSRPFAALAPPRTPVRHELADDWVSAEVAPPILSDDTAVPLRQL